MHNTISGKTNQVLRVLLLAMLLILFRLWHLCFLQKEEMHERALKPQRKTIIEPAERGTIHDRFNVGLALNRISYKAAIYYSQISQIPAVSWIKDESGKKMKRYPRREYVQDLAKLLGSELEMDPDRICDLIYAKAALLPHVPFIIKENLSEKEYYRLRMLERDWAGLHAQKTAERFYPLGPVGADVLGYMGSIAQQEYIAIADELRQLDAFFEDIDQGQNLRALEVQDYDEAKIRFKELKEKAYSLNDWIGKAGIEKSFEEDLRGAYGIKSYEVDVKGNFLQELRSSKEAAPGRRIVLSLSAELQEYAEALLAEEETEREKRTRQAGGKAATYKTPWIKGGAIVAMDPNTGEVLALASYPRFDPNDYIRSKNPKEKDQAISRINEWLETEQHIASLWDGKEMLRRELYSSAKKNYYEEAMPITWDTFLDFIIPQESDIRLSLDKVNNVQKAIELQEDFESLLFLSGENNAALVIDALFPQEDKNLLASPHSNDVKGKVGEAWKAQASDFAALKKKIQPVLSNISHNMDKLFLLDLCRLAVHSPAFSDELIEKVGKLSLPAYQELTKTVLKIDEAIKKELRPLFHSTHFALWKKEHQKDYLQEMRAKEKSLKTYARPYIDYLDRKERELFNEFWQKNRLDFLFAYCKRSFQEENDERSAYFAKIMQLSKDPLPEMLSKTLEDALLFNFLKTVRSFHDLDRPLYHHSARLQKKNEPLLERHLAAAFYPQTGFGFSRSFAFRQSTVLGSIFKLVTAYSVLKDRIAEENPRTLTELNPFTMIDEFRWDMKAGKKGSFVVGYNMDHTPYARMYKGGRMPRSLNPKIGKIDLYSAIEQSSNPYFSVLASDYLKDPEDLVEAARTMGFGERTNIALPGEYPGLLPTDVRENRTGLYALAIGQHSLVVTPLQTAVMLSALANHGKILKPQIVHALIGKKESHVSGFSSLPESYPYQNELAMVGIHFPLFTQVLKEDRSSTFYPTECEIKKTIYLPELLRTALFEGMERVVSGERGLARPAAIRSLRQDASLMEYYKNLKHQFIGKSSTAEIMHNPYMHPSSKALMMKHVGFGAISFESEGKTRHLKENPELVIVVFLRFGESGKDGAPIAARILKKYRELKAKYQQG